MQIDCYVVYFTAGDGSDIKHKVFVDHEEAIKYALKITNKILDKNFTAYTQMIEWFENLDNDLPSDPGQIHIIKTVIFKKDI
jgi:hypothetical protein